MKVQRFWNVPDAFKLPWALSVNIIRTPLELIICSICNISLGWQMSYATTPWVSSMPSPYACLSKTRKSAICHQVCLSTGINWACTFANHSECALSCTKTWIPNSCSAVAAQIWHHLPANVAGSHELWPLSLQIKNTTRKNLTVNHILSRVRGHFILFLSS